MKDGWMLAICRWHGNCTEEMWHHVWPWSNTKISANNKHVQLIHQSTYVLRLQLIPTSPPHIRLVDRLRIFYHDSFFTRVDRIIQCINTFMSTMINKNDMQQLSYSNYFICFADILYYMYTVNFTLQIPTKLQLHLFYICLILPWCHAQHCCPLWAFNEPGPRHQYHVTRDCRVDTHASSGSIVVTGEPYSSDV